MADKLGLGPETRELKLGTSFTNPRAVGFHTLRYDFKPASADMNQMSTMDVGSSGQVTVTVPPNNVFKGSAKPYQKQCVVVINMETNEITLEKLSCNIQVKKTRSEKPPSSMPPTIPTLELPNSKGRKPGMNGSKSKPGASRANGKSKSQFLATSLSNTVPKHSPLHASPNRKSPNSTNRLSPNGVNGVNGMNGHQNGHLNGSSSENRSYGMSNSLSMPMPMDEDNGFSDTVSYPDYSSFSKRGHAPMKNSQPPPPPPPPERRDVYNGDSQTRALSDSSSSSSTSDSSDSDSSDEGSAPPRPKPPPPLQHHNPALQRRKDMAPEEDQLKNDLALSESESD